VATQSLGVAVLHCTMLHPGLHLVSGCVRLSSVCVRVSSVCERVSLVPETPAVTPGPFK
jgi:hypothetical protein